MSTCRPASIIRRTSCNWLSNQRPNFVQHVPFHVSFVPLGDVVSSLLANMVVGSPGSKLYVQGVFGSQCPLSTLSYHMQ